MTNVLYEDGPCLVVFKPPGVLTQAPPGIDSLEVRIKRFLAKRDGLAEDVYLAVPHRLDRPVSGAMVFARDRKSAKRLSKQFERRTVRKVYWGCVEGEVRPAEGTWRDHVRKLPDVAKGEIVDPDHSDGRPAVLHYRTLGRTPHGSWLQIELETGRYHQIRIQAAARGFPLLGDATYGSRVAFGPQYEDERRRAIALHARELSFAHPVTKEQVTVTAELTKDWAVLGIADPKLNGEQND